MSEPMRGYERLFLMLLLLIALGIFFDTAATFTVITVNDRRITGNQRQIMDIANRVALNTDRLRILDEQHYLNLLQFRALSAQLNAVRQTLALPKAVKPR